MPSLATPLRRARDPVQHARILVRHLAGRRRSRPSRDDLHLVSHQTGMHAGPASRARCATATRLPTRVRRRRRALLTWSAGRAARSTRPSTSSTPCGCAATGLGLRIAAAAAALTPFTGTYLFTDPIDGGSAVFTSYETGRRYRDHRARAASCAIDGAEALGAASARSSSCRATAGWEIAIEEFETARPPYGRSGVVRRAGRRGRRREFAAFVDAVAPLAGRRNARRRARRLRAVVGDRRAARLPPARVGADVQALDGQGVELGPLLQRPRPGAPATPSSPGPVPDAVRPPGRRPARCPTRSPTPRCSTTSSSRRSTAGRSASCARDCPSSIADDARRGLRPAGRLDPLLARPPPRARPRAAALPARQRQRLGQLHHLRPRPRHRVARPRRLPRLQLDELAAPRRRARRSRARRTGGRQRDAVAAALLAELWDGDALRRPSARDRRGPARPAACST